MGLISIFDDSDFQIPEQLDNLLRNYPTPVDAVWIKATQGTWWVSELAPKLAEVCGEHNTPHGYYHFAEGQQMSLQRAAFTNAILKWPKPKLGHMLDYEDPTAVAKEDLGIAHFAPDICYASEDYWLNHNWGRDVPCVKWVAQYFNDRSFVQSQADRYFQLGMSLWQFADYAVINGVRWNQDVSALLIPDLKPLEAFTFD